VESVTALVQHRNRAGERDPLDAPTFEDKISIQLNGHVNPQASDRAG
jgi:hypothetical protein